MTSWGQALAETTVRLRDSGIPSARLDSRLLLAQAVGVEPVSVFSNPANVLSGDQERRLAGLVTRRLGREPMSHILGRREFWSLEFKVTPATLDPRPDTETVIEAVMESILDRYAPYRILDLGTGSGCILLALLSELPNATGIGVDISEAALAVAGANAFSLNLDHRARFAFGDWGREIDGLFNVIVSNPPYIPDNDIDRLEPEVARFEPRLALAGGCDGLECYRALAPDIARLLAPEGIAALEVGQGQDQRVGKILEDAGLTKLASRCDLGGVARCVTAYRPDDPST